MYANALLHLNILVDQSNQGANNNNNNNNKYYHRPIIDVYDDHVMGMYVYIETVPNKI